MQDERKRKYIVVRTVKGIGHKSFQLVDHSTTHVHIDGHPFLSAIEKIISRAPKLKAVRVVPTMRKKVSANHRTLLRKHRVRLISGYHKPKCAWSPSRQIPKAYSRQREFMLLLTGDQKKLFDELLVHSVDLARIGSRYFCLNDEPHVSQRELCSMFGHPESNHQVISTKKNALLYYLGFSDPSFHPRVEAKTKAKEVEKKIAKLRHIARKEEATRKFHEQFRMKYGATVDADFPLERLPLLEGLLKILTTTKCLHYRRAHPREWETLKLRFGLDRISRGKLPYRTLAQIGNLLGTGKECTRQREQRALKYFCLI